LTAVGCRALLFEGDGNRRASPSTTASMPGGVVRGGVLPVPLVRPRAALLLRAVSREVAARAATNGQPAASAKRRGTARSPGPPAGVPAAPGGARDGAGWRRCS